MAGFFEVGSVEEVEDAQVEEEGVVGLTGVGLAAASEGLRGLVPEGAVIGHRGAAGVGRSDGGIGQEIRRVPALDHVEVVRLDEVQCRVIETVHRAGVVEESVRVAIAALERPAVGDVGLCVAVVVDVDVVVGSRSEGIEVRASRRLLERDPVADQGDRVRLVGGHESVEVGAIELGLRRQERSLFAEPSFQCAPADLVHHPALEERLGRHPQIEVRIEFAAEAFDVQQRFLEEHELRLDLDIEASRRLEQAYEYLAERDFLQRLVENRLEHDADFAFQLVDP